MSYLSHLLITLFTVAHPANVCRPLTGSARIAVVNAWSTIATPQLPVQGMRDRSRVIRNQRRQTEFNSIPKGIDDQ